MKRTLAVSEQKLSGVKYWRLAATPKMNVWILQANVGQSAVASFFRCYDIRLNIEQTICYKLKWYLGKNGRNFKVYEDDMP